MEGGAGRNFNGLELNLFHSGRHASKEKRRQLPKVPNITRTLSRARPAPKEIAVAIHINIKKSRSHSYWPFTSIADMELVLAAVTTTISFHSVMSLNSTDNGQFGNVADESAVDLEK